jgi:hypothetical protein
MTENWQVFQVGMNATKTHKKSNKQDFSLEAFLCLLVA